MYLNKTCDIYVPVPYWNISAFRHSLGHKINHSFKYNNTKFGFAYHPRFGNVRAIVTTKNITKGEEILTVYGYELGSRVPQWYSDLYWKDTGIDWYSHKKNSRQNQRKHNPSSKHVKNHQRQKQCTWGK